ncbi:hypothetical protein ACG04R_20800 [Roseateles sp. BYS78W]|uniref:Uncharacterized protein n=1 Tax=Pelomonas candidula TaxID=3299025 RepID=A0ABW7HHJ1_9BURK
MNSPYRWIASTLLAVALVLVAVAAPAFTDSNADLKEVAADRTARVVVLAKAQPPRPVAWVPQATAKQLDGFKPVLPPEHGIAAGHPPAQQTLAQADAAR